MKKALTILPLLLLAWWTQAAERITATITVTNTPGTTNSITINSTFRYWTNASTLGTIQTNLTGKNAATTNLYNQIAGYPYPGGIILRWADTNQIQLIGALSGALAGSIGGTWATLTLSTQSGPQTYTALWPMENMVGATNRTNQGSALVSGLSAYSTNAFATNSTAVSNHLQKGAGPRQYVLSEVQYQTLVAAAFAQLTNANLINSTNRGYIVTLTNGYWTNATLDSPKFTNAANYGNAFSSPGAGSGSEQFGTGSLSTTNFGTAIGNGAVAGWSSFAGGYLANASESNSVAIGAGADVSAMSAIAIGQNTSVTGYKASAFGQAAQSDFENSTAIGQGSITTKSNQVVLGASTHFVTLPGVTEIASATNATLRGTNIINGRLDLTSRANSGLANGNNAGVILGTNVYVRLSGPSASYTINGIAAEQDGSWHICEFVNPVNSLIIANNSGTDPTAANRINTGTGGDVTFTNNPVVLQFIYNATDARWKIANWFR